MRPRLSLLAMAMAGMFSACGCNMVKYVLYVVTPVAETKTVQAEYCGLENRSVAIVVFAGPEIMCDYYTARLEVALAIRGELEKNIPGVKVVEPAKVVKYQDGNINWEVVPKAKLGEVFGVERVLFISLVEYRGRDPGSENIYRGTITATAAVYESSPPVNEAVWRSSQLRVSFPDQVPVGTVGSESRIRQETQQRFAQTLVRKFYKHKIKEKP